MNETLIYSLLQGIQRENPRIHDLIRELIKQVQIHNNELFPATTPASSAQDNVNSVVADVLSFTYTLILDGINFSWTRPDGVSFFEIRKGTDWDSSVRQLVTSSLSAVLDGLPPGTYQYWIKGIDANGAFSLNPLGVSVVIPALGAISITGNVIDNYVLLYWSIPTSSFRIDRYLVKKNGSLVGEQAGTFVALFEQTSGDYTYSVQARDIYDNLSPEASITVTVAQPVDYLLEDIQTSDLDGTRTNTLLDSAIPSLLANVDLTETWEDHFINNGWTTIQDQIDDGLPYFLQPTLTTGGYVEVFDYGAAFANVIANVDWNFQEIVPSMQVQCYMSSSLDDVTYSAESLGTQLFATSVRYIKVRLAFTALN